MKKIYEEGKIHPNQETYPSWVSKEEHERIIVEKYADIKLWKESGQAMKDQRDAVREILSEKLASANAMIEKLKEMLECHCGCVPCRGQCVSESAFKIMREECLSELTEWEKTK